MPKLPLSWPRLSRRLLLRRLPHNQRNMRFCGPMPLPNESVHHKRSWSVYLTTPSKRWSAYMSEAELDRLCDYITEYSLGDTPREVSPVSVDSALKSIDLMHFGWNIGKAFGKRRIHTATFIKRVFAHTLRDIEVSTIERKMSHTESECRIKLDDTIM